MIHPSSIVDSSAVIAADAEIGPWCEIGADVTVGNGTRIGSHCVVSGPTRIGNNNRIYSHNVIGGDSQDKKFHGEEAWLEIGDNNTIREFCTLNRGTADGGGSTKIGHDNWLMSYCHVAHDCIVGNQIVMANNASLAGHVTVEDFAILGGFTLVHQFCAVGAYSFSAMGSVIVKDVPPYVMVAGNTAAPHGLNAQGLKRHGFSSGDLKWIKRAYKCVYRQGLSIEAALQDLRKMEADCVAVAPLRRFIESSERGIVR